DTYLRMQALQEETGRSEKSVRQEAAPQVRDVEAAEAAARQKTKPKRRFPYRKVEDLETEIAQAESHLQELEKLLASSELYRDKDKVKETMKAFEDTKTALKQLYEHWDEAMELN